MICLNTIGFSGKTAEEFFTLLLKNDVCKLLDIRLNNKSQLSGFTNAKHLPYFLNLHNINYSYKPEYAPTKELLQGYKKKNIEWKDYEKTYADLMKTRNILSGIDWELFDNAVLLCSEPSPEKCHRRLLAEILAGENGNIKVRHL